MHLKEEMSTVWSFLIKLDLCFIKCAALLRDPAMVKGCSILQAGFLLDFIPLAWQLKEGIYPAR